MNVAHLIELIPTKSAHERLQMRGNAHRLLESGGAQAADAKALLVALDAFEAQEREACVRHVAGLDNVERIVEAFQTKPITDAERHIVQVLLDNPGLSSEALTEKAGWKAEAWHMRFGLMSRDRDHFLWPAPFDENRRANFYSGILADFDEETRGFTMKPEAVEAFARLGLRARGTA